MSSSRPIQDFWPVGTRVTVPWVPGQYKTGTIVEPAAGERLDPNDRVVQFDDAEVGRRPIYTGHMDRSLEFETIARAVAEMQPIQPDGDCRFCRELLGFIVTEFDTDDPARIGKRHGKHALDCLWLRARRAFGMDATPDQAGPSSDD